ncbi:SLOG family protein [Nocardia goodfellowii]
MNPLRILVTGSRHWPDRATVDNALTEQHNLSTELTVVHGDNPRGADRMARDWCTRHPEVTEERHPADWNRHGRAAGPIRNAHMIERGADLVLAFPLPSSVGTRDCISRAENARIPVRIIPLGGIGYLTGREGLW